MKPGYYWLINLLSNNRQIVSIMEIYEDGSIMVITKGDEFYIDIDELKEMYPDARIKYVGDYPDYEKML